MLTTPHFVPAREQDRWKFVSLAHLHDGRHGLAAAHPDALLHDAVGPLGAQVRRLVAVLHLPALLHGAGPGDADQAAAARSEPGDRGDRQVVRGWWRISTWVKHWSSVGMLAVADQNGDGIVQLNEFFMRPDIVVLATPEIAGLPYVISGLVAAGGLAAAMSTADGLLLAIANALSATISTTRSSTRKPTRGAG